MKARPTFLLSVFFFLAFLSSSEERKLMDAMEQISNCLNTSTEVDSEVTQDTPPPKEPFGTNTNTNIENSAVTSAASTISCPERNASPPPPVPHLPATNDDTDTPTAEAPPVLVPLATTYAEATNVRTTPFCV
jgi:hypothetical protein